MTTQWIARISCDSCLQTQDVLENTETQHILIHVGAKTLHICPNCRDRVTIDLWDPLPHRSNRLWPPTEEHIVEEIGTPVEGVE